MKKTWWKEAVVYQVYWRSFYDSNGDGIGDLQGVIEKLDYIQELGADVIWLNPFYESPDRDNGYDISDYEKIMSKAGNMEIFERLVDEIHDRGMKVIMDLVVNHTSDQHSWFLESKSSLDNEKRDWYIWKQPKNGGKPNNWRSYFEPSTWTFDERTGEYYFHSFAVEQPDLNWQNEDLRHEIYRMMRSWLDKGIDGFRMDVINLLAKQDGFPDAENPDHISYLADNPGIHEYLQEMNREVLQHYDGMTVGEIPFVTPETGLLYVHEDRNELNTLFHFQVADEMPVMDLPKYKEIQENWYKGLQGKGWNSQFLNNHDHTRQVTRYGNDGKYRTESAKLLATMLHTLPGMPYVYQGEELGMTGVRFDSIEDYNDIAMKNKYKEEVEKGGDPKEVFEGLLLLSRDNSRTPMHWNDSKNAGFSNAEPWININPNYKSINAQQALEDPHSIFYYYKKLISLRKENPVMVYGDYEDLSKDHEKLYVYTRSYENKTWLIMLNHSDHEQVYQMKEELSGSDVILVIGNYKNDADKSILPSSFTLKPHEARVYEID
ncbi:alpha-glucosidase [Jeotgalibacillus sp. S-D1]|uniref:glycoside hydrolase family 13 protein n=1 Tax=Jeotgalibacillus sp. S-D1 TaxID=2552189 RepID=UPI00105A3806|nr:alpha-glucosidase [Jeotgalibacillus sp. S-D1]TDL34204.1 alpha-glucosidase [Jeotgalibacillus sp. S-D1]